MLSASDINSHTTLERDSYNILPNQDSELLPRLAPLFVKKKTVEAMNVKIAAAAKQEKEKANVLSQYFTSFFVDTLSFIEFLHSLILKATLF